MDGDGLITIQSQYTLKETMQRLDAGVKAKGMTVFAHIDHAAGAAEVGMALRPTLIRFDQKRGPNYDMADESPRIIFLSSRETRGHVSPVLSGRASSH